MRANSNKPSRRGNRAGAAVQATKAIPTAKEIHRDAQDLGITDGITIEFRTQDVVDLSDKGVIETQLYFKREFTADRRFRGKISGDFRPRRITVGDKEITVVSVEVDSAMVNDFLTHFSAITFGLSGGRDVTWTATPHDKVSSATMILQYALASFFVNGQMDTYRKIRLRLTEGVIREETTNILDGFYDKVEHLYQQMEQWVLVATASGETMQTAMDETLHLDLADAEQELDGGNGRIQLHIAQRQAAYIKPTGRLAKAQTGEGGFIPVLMIKNLRRMAGEGCGFCRSPACDWRTCQAQEARNYRKAIIAVEEPLGNLQPANIRDTKPWRNTSCLHEEPHHPHPLTPTIVPVTPEEVDTTANTCVTLHLKDPSHTEGHLLHLPMRTNDLKHNEAHTPTLPPQNVAINRLTVSYSRGTGGGGVQKHHGGHLGGQEPPGACTELPQRVRRLDGDARGGTTSGGCTLPEGTGRHARGGCRCCGMRHRYLHAPQPQGGYAKGWVCPPQHLDQGEGHGPRGNTHRLEAPGGKLVQHDGDADRSDHLECPCGKLHRRGARGSCEHGHFSSGGIPTCGGLGVRGHHGGVGDGYGRDASLNSHGSYNVPHGMKVSTLPPTHKDVNVRTPPLQLPTLHIVSTNRASTKCLHGRERTYTYKAGDKIKRKITKRRGGSTQNNRENPGEARDVQLSGAQIRNRMYTQAEEHIIGHPVTETSLGRNIINAARGMRWEWPLARMNLGGGAPLLIPVLTGQHWCL